MTRQARQHGGWLTKLALATVTSLASVLCFLQAPLPAKAFSANQNPRPIAIATMTKNNDAAAKDAEGKLESAYGELTGDVGHQIKGKAKQVKASAMSAAEDIKEGAKSITEKVSEAAKDVVDNIS